MQLQKELEELNRMLLKMADIVQNNIKEAIEAYREDKDIIINDKIVNQYENLINEICIDILIRERLYGKDLREVLAIIKLVADIERIGDHAEDIEKYNEKLRGFLIMRPIEIDQMINIALEMFKKAITSYIKKDLDLAREVIKQDDEVDTIYQDILTSFTQQNNFTREAITFAIYTTIVIKYIERIADHSVNIAEWVIFIVDGMHEDNEI